MSGKNMKNAIILHGAGSNSQGNWFPWLKNALEKRGYLVWVPDLPNSDIPMREAWLDTIFANKEWKFTSESIIIGHSAGATCILRLLEKLPDRVRIKKSILVAGPVELGTKQEYFQYKEDLVKDPFDWDKIKNSCDTFYFVHSDNDQYQCGIDQGKILHQHLGGKIVFRPGERHFNLESGIQYKKFPLLINLIEQ